MFNLIKELLLKILFIITAPIWITICVCIYLFGGDKRREEAEAESWRGMKRQEYINEQEKKHAKNN